MPDKDHGAFFGGPDGDGVDMQFDFIGMQNIYLSLARGDARPIAKALKQRPHLDGDQPVGELRPRNHDELTLDKLSDEERQEVFDASAHKDMQLYGRGLRRRLPSMLGGDQQRMRMAYSLASRCRELPSCSTAKRSGWPKTSIYQAGWRCARRCSGPAAPMAASRRRRSDSSAVPCRRPLRTGPGQRRRPAARPRVVLVVHAQSDLHLPVAARDRLVDGRGVEAAEFCGAGPRVPEESGWAMVAVHNFGSDSAIVPIELTDVPPGVEAGGPAGRPLRARAGRKGPYRGRASSNTGTTGSGYCDRRTTPSSDPINSEPQASLAQW